MIGNEVEQLLADVTCWRAATSAEMGQLRPLESLPLKVRSWFTQQTNGANGFVTQSAVFISHKHRPHHHWRYSLHASLISAQNLPHIAVHSPPSTLIAVPVM